MIQKPLTSISSADLENLVTQEVPEGKSIEYKLQLPDLKPASNRKEFLADVSSFANCVGGDLLYGIKEDKGLPIELIGLDITDPDALRLQLEQIIQAGIAPRIPGIAILFIPLQNGKSILLVRILRSWIAPHVVWLEAQSKFFSRNSAGKYQMDYEEMRSSFLATDTIQVRLNRFRQERVSQIQVDASRFILPTHVALVVHFLPMISFASSFAADLRKVAKDTDLVAPLNHYGYNSRFNFDGFISYTGPEPERSSYLQLFRNGALEVYDLIHTQDFPAGHVETLIVDNFSRFLRLLSSAECQPPLFCGITIINVADRALALPRHWLTHGRKCKQDVLFLPEIALSELTDFSPITLRPAFDVLWNSFGLDRSYSFDDQGAFKPTR